MKEFIEKLIGRLGEYQGKLKIKCGSRGTFDFMEVDAVKEIVNELAEEYKHKVMIDGQYCWQNCGATEHCKECNRLGNGTVDYFENYDFMAEEYKGGWISVSEKLPEMNEYVLCSMNQKKPMIIHDIIIAKYDGADYWHNGFVLAWQPLPKPYKGE